MVNEGALDSHLQTPPTLDGGLVESASASVGSTKSILSLTPTCDLNLGSLVSRSMFTRCFMLLADKIVPVQQQTNPPSIPVEQLFADGRYPHGHLSEYQEKYELMMCECHTNSWSDQQSMANNKR
jgi:hypothetical protein